MVYAGRYIALMMGAFSIYTGLIYNDIFSKPLSLFRSGWEWPEKFEVGQTVNAKQVGVYPLGIDYAWHLADNQLLFSNSYKMKMSVVLGFCHVHELFHALSNVQMLFSLCFSFVNYRNFGSTLDIYANFLPSIIFMCSIFGYLVLCILYKWSVDWYARGQRPPGLLNMLIYMFLSPSTIEDPLYRGQRIVQNVLLLIALICVPWLLLMKPLVLRWESKRNMARGYEGLPTRGGHRLSDDEPPSAVDQRFSLGEREEDNDDEEMVFMEMQLLDAHSEEFDFSEAMIHQVIHTIEFCLNCVSHTASYLRLWGISFVLSLF